MLTDIGPPLLRWLNKHAHAMLEQVGAFIEFIEDWADLLDVDL